MTGWREQFFDVGSGRWEASALNHTAIQCTPMYGNPIYLVEVSRTKTVQMPKREAVYLALAMNSRKVAGYDCDRRTLRIPTYAPLPDRCARLACLAAEKCATVSGGMVEYGPLPGRVAYFILAAVGQY